MQDSKHRRLGYLITSKDRFPALTAFVPRVGLESLNLALQIRADQSKAGSSGAIDLRMHNAQIPFKVRNMMLLPVDSRGRWIATDRVSVAGMFISTQPDGSSPNFLTMTRDGMERVQKNGFPKLPATLTPAKQVSGAAKKAA